MCFSDINDFKTAKQNPMYKNILTKDTTVLSETKTNEKNRQSLLEQANEDYI